VPIRNVKKLAASIVLKSSTDQVPLSKEVMLRDVDEEAAATAGAPQWVYEVLRTGPLDGSSANFFIRARQELIRNKVLTHTGAPKQTKRR
jgi:hypothetical protein